VCGEREVDKHAPFCGQAAELCDFILADDMLTSVEFLGFICMYVIPVLK